MDKVELVYTKDCPNIEAARKALLKAFTKAKLTPHWHEWDTNNPDAPDHVHGYGSPTIFINEADITDSEPSGTGNSCRIYPDSEHERQRAPSVQQIFTALVKNKPLEDANSSMKDSIRYNFAIVPSVFIAVLPKLTCPACWPAYTAILSSMGIGFVNYTPYLFPFTIIFLVVAIIALYYQARIQKQYMSFIIGLVSSLVIMAGKFFLDNNLVMYFGLAMLMAASLWNIKYTLAASRRGCTVCESSTDN
jgi:mercuric ion transport protein